MVGVLLFLATLAGGGSWAGWRLSAVGRASRRARREVDALLAERELTRAALQRRERELQREAERFTEARRVAQRKALPVESLKEHGASQVRWARLAEAGYRTLQDVHEAGGRELLAVQGIGPLSTQRLKAAARRADATLAGTPVPLPSPALDEKHAPELVRSAVDLLEARRQLGEVARRLDEAGAALEARAAVVRRESGFLRWVLGSAAAEDRLARVQRAQALADDALAARTTCGAEAAAARAALREAGFRRPADSAALAAAWQGRRAELASVLSLVLAPAGEVRAPIDEGIGARLPDQIVQRVQALALRDDELSVVLRRYQHFGARFMLVQERTILGDDMGLGKTLQALAAMVHLRATGEGGRFLVVAPATVVPSWMTEIGRHTRLPCHELRGGRRERALDAWLEQGGVGVTSYSTLGRLEVDALLPASLDLLVADEAHFLKNPEAARTRAVAELLPMSRRVCFLTGTPLENRLDEFRLLVRMLRPALLTDAQWQAAGGVLDPASFQREVAGVYLRRNQADVLPELPSRIEKREWVELAADDAAGYRAAVASGNIMAMRRSASLGAWTPELPAPPRSAKLDRLADLLEEHAAAGRKVLVFSFFRDVLAAIERRLPVFGSIHGDVPFDEREAIMQRFRELPGPAVLLGQITAAGVGLNLQAASVVVLVEPQWKPSTEEQAIARAHRMGQTERVLVHRLLARESVDERLVELVEGKRELFERYARGSLLAATTEEATETDLARLVVAVEQARLQADAAGPSAGQAAGQTAGLAAGMAASPVPTSRERPVAGPAVPGAPADTASVDTAPVDTAPADEAPAAEAPADEAGRPPAVNA